MRRDALALLGVCVGVSALWLACTKTNPRYCRSTSDCQPGEYCDTGTDQCEAGRGDMGVVDLAGRVDLADPPDMPVPRDMTDEPPECSKDSECAAKTATPACVNSKCVQCTRNYQCPDAACIPAGSSGAGSCADKSRMIYVDNNVAANCSATGAGGRPYCRVDQALGGVSASRDHILLRTSGTPYQNNGNFLDVAKSVRIVGERTDRLAAPPFFTDPVRLTPGAAAIDFAMEDLNIKLLNAGDTVAIRCTRQAAADRVVAVTLRWMRYDGNPTVAFLSDGCNDAKILNSVFVRNAAAASTAAVSIIGGNVKIANTVIASNTPSGSSKGGGLYLGEAPIFKLTGIDLSFNTIADNTCAAGACNFLSDVTAPMNYSIVTGAAATVSSTVTLNNSVTPVDYSAGSGNVMPAGLVPKFVNAPLADYHLTNDAANSVLRISTNGVPVESTDIDSDPRPTIDGKVDVGADQRVP